MRAALPLLLCTGGACIGALPSRSFAQAIPKSPLAVVAAGSCPESIAVENVLSSLLPADSPAMHDVALRVSDFGDEYLVAVGELVKSYVDANRDCAGRARVAAVFMALALSPAQRAVEAPPAAAAPPPVPDAAPSPPKNRGWLRVDMRGSLQVAPSDGLVAPGAILDVTGGWNAFGAHAECAWLSGATLPVSGVGAIVVERFPCAAGPTVRVSPSGVVEAKVDAGLALGAVRATGRGFATSYDAARLEVGGRLAVDMALHLGGLAAGLSPVVGLEASYFPRTYDLDVMPRGVVAQTPSLWAGITAGMCWSIE